jgi:hypothetical protein
MTNRIDGPMRPSIRLKPGPALRAFLDRWLREEKARRPRLTLVEGGRQ